jgi:hypothetical protein
MLKVNFLPKYSIILVATCLPYLNANAVAFNDKESGIFISGAIGASQSQSYIVNSNSYSVGTGGSYNYDFDRQYSASGTINIGYKASFGDRNTWNAFYFGGSVDYYNFGKVIDPNSSQVSKNGNTGDITVNSTEYLNLNALGGEIFIGKYLASPFSIEAGLGIGGNINGPSQGLMGVFRFRVGYDFFENFKVFVQYVGASFQKDTWNPVFFFSDLEYNNNGITINNEQIGIEYTF